MQLLSDTFSLTAGAYKFILEVDLTRFMPISTSLSSLDHKSSKLTS